MPFDWDEKCRIATSLVHLFGDTIAYSVNLACVDGEGDERHRAGPVMTSPWTHPKEHVWT